jgi:hypothetical protein
MNGQQVVGPSAENSISTSGWGALQRVLDGCMESEAGLNHVAEHMQNRGVKLLVKAYAQQRAAQTRELQKLLDEYKQSEPDAQVGGVRRGLTDIATAMTLGRKNQEHLILQQQLELERKLLELYATALTVGLPAPVHQLIERQRNQIATVYDRLEELDEEGDAQLVVRLFDQASEAEQAVARLRAAGFDEASYQVLDIEQIPVHRESATTRGRSQRTTIVAGAVIGAVVGALIGGAVALFQTLMPNMALNISVDPLSMFLSSALIGAGFGVIFGWLIGRNKVEDDAFVYEASLSRGEKLVAVHTDAAHIDQVERILKLRHERELDRI